MDQWEIQRIEIAQNTVFFESKARPINLSAAALLTLCRILILTTGLGITQVAVDDFWRINCIGNGPVRILKL
jgi:hypothetical protein